MSADFPADQRVLLTGLRDTFRYDDQLFRFGGKEFVIVLQPASEESAAGAFERFRNCVARYETLLASGAPLVAGQ